MYHCLHCSSSNVVPFDAEYATGVGSETWSESAWRCLDCAAVEQTAEWVDEDSDAASLEAA